MINRVLLYNSGGGVGDALQTLPLINALKNTFFTVDTRILAIYRILFGSVLLFDILSRFSVIHLFYTSKSIFPTSYILSSPYKIIPFTFDLIMSGIPNASDAIGTTFACKK